MSIRRLMVMLSVGVGVPLALVGLAMLWGLWRESREQLDASVEKHISNIRSMKRFANRVEIAPRLWAQSRQLTRSASSRPSQFNE